MHKESAKESEMRKEKGPGAGLSPEDRWTLWVSIKVKMRAFNEKQAILQALKRDREAER